MAMGVSAWEWEQLKSGFDDFIARAESYIKHGLADEALEELKAAQIIHPNDLEMHRCFSQAYLQLWRAKSQQKYADLAEQHAKTCLQINSEYEFAVKILAQLKQKATPQKASYQAPNARVEWKGKQQLQEQKTSQNPVIFIGAIVGVIILFMVYYVLMPSGSSSNYNNHVEREVESPQTTTSENNSTESNTDEYNPIKPSSNDKSSNNVTPKGITKQYKSSEVEVPVTFDTKNHNNIKFETQRSIFRRPDQYSIYKTYYTLTGFASIENAKAESIELIYDLYDGDKIIATDKSYVSVPKGARPGDKIPFLALYSNREESYQISKATFRISRARTKAAKAQYPSSPEVKLIWKTPKTNKVDLSLKERFSEVKYNPYSKDMLHSMTFLVENKGSAHIKEIKCKINWYDANGKLINEDIFSLWAISNPRLAPQQVALTPNRVVGLDVGQKKIEVKNYTLEILEVKYE